jgi:hypothetical protein
MAQNLPTPFQTLSHARFQPFAGNYSLLKKGYLKKKQGVTCLNENFKHSKL